jgi:hypothetical protein
MPFGIRPSNVRVCHSTTRAFEFATARQNLPQAMRRGKRPFGALVSLELPLVIVSETESSIAMSTRARDVKFAQYVVKVPDAVDRAE